MISVVVETDNLGGRGGPRLEGLLEALRPQLEAAGAELVITAERIAADERLRLGAIAGRSIRWVELPLGAGYYEHKNRGFDASSGSIVAFTDGDCSPAPGWLEALIAPIRDRGAEVAAGVTRYPGRLSELATAVDFPLVGAGAGTVRNFFANNVAFARATFAARRYPRLAPMYHGQCQVLGLRLAAAGVEVHAARAARVTHAWPDDLRGWLAVRLLRGADSRSLLPHIAASHAPSAAPLASRLSGPITAALLATRGIAAAIIAARRRPRLAGLGFVAAITAIDTAGAAAAPLVYRWLG